MMILFLCVVINQIQEKHHLWKLFLGLLTWSIVVQYIGAEAFSGGWESRRGEVFSPEGKSIEWAYDADGVKLLMRKYPTAPHETRTLNIDLQEYRSRLWDWRDSPIAYYVSNYDQEKKKKFSIIQNWIDYC